MDGDEDLVRAARSGDLDAFEALVERHRGVVLRVSARIVGRQDAEDVAQDAFLRAYHRLGSFRGDSPFRSWLMRIAHNTAIDAVSRKVPEPVGAIALAEVERRDGPRPPAESLELRERLERMDSKLRLLRTEHRSVLVLRDVEGLSYDEVAQVTDTPVGSVKGRLHRARAELIDLLRSNTYDWDLPDERTG